LAGAGDGRPVRRRRQSKVGGIWFPGRKEKTRTASRRRKSWLGLGLETQVFMGLCINIAGVLLKQI
jgi:hypothetical protein